MSKQKSVNTITAKLLTECLEIHSERHVRYGPSEINFADIAKIATRVSLQCKKFTALDVVTVMLATKEARYKHQYKLWQDFLEEDDNDLDEDEGEEAEVYSEKVLHDSLIDWINYLAIMENVRILTQNT